MKIWEHYSLEGNNYAETVLEVANKGIFEYLVYGSLSGTYQTNLTVGTARSLNILDESTLPRPSED